MGKHVAPADSVVLLHATVYPSSETPPIKDATVVIRAGRIEVVGRDAVGPKTGRVLDCTGLVVTAGFQNSHVHFTEPKWLGALRQPGAKLEQQLQAMLTRWGDTTVVDLGSDLSNTTALRSRIDSGEVSGPRILTAGGGLYPPHGTPFYLRDTLPGPVLAVLESNSEPATPEAAAQLVRDEIAHGADVTKLFTGSLISPREVQLMPEPVAEAAVREAHRSGRIVFAHPSNLDGLRVAMHAGVDVLAHTTSEGEQWTPTLISEMLSHRMALVPTLKLWEYEMAKIGESAGRAEALALQGAQELGAFARAGGQVLFGTDVGYMTDYDPTAEYVLMSRGGLSNMQILAALTTAPAERFGESQRRGRVAPGMDGDLVVLGADPSSDPRAFADVRYTIRAGRVIYAASGAASPSR
jgi:imidazolonepropionase-like amidohydrolase